MRIADDFVSIIAQKTHIAALKKNGCSHLVTLLSHKENAEQIGSAAKAADIGWIWLPLVNGDPPEVSDMERIHEGIHNMATLLTAENVSLMIHCSAGIHRTGMITNALLRYLGLSAEDSLKKIGLSREHTAAEVGEHRLAWGQSFIDTVGLFSTQQPNTKGTPTESKT